MNAKSRKDIVRLHTAIRARIDELYREEECLEWGSYQREEIRGRIRALDNQLSGMNYVLALIAPDKGVMRGFGLIVKDGEMRQRVGALTVDDFIGRLD